MKELLKSEELSGLYIRKDDVLWGKLSCIEKTSSDLWKKDSIFHRYYTIHGEKHIENLLTNLKILLPKKCQKGLNNMEIFLLLAAVWLHDIGMLLIRNNEKDNKPEDVEKIRKEHHSRSEELIHKFKEIKYQFDNHERSVVREIVKAHGLNDIRKLKDDQIRTFQVKIPYLAALLRLADICDVTYQRACLISRLLPFPEDARQHWFPIEYVSGIRLLREGEANKIVLFGRIPLKGYKKYQEIIESLFVHNIKNELDKTLPILAQNGLHITEVCSSLEKDKYMNPFPDNDLTLILSKARDLSEKNITLDEMELRMIKLIYRRINYQTEIAKQLHISDKAVKNILANLIGRKIIVGSEITNPDGKRLIIYKICSDKENIIIKKWDINKNRN